MSNKVTELSVGPQQPITEVLTVLNHTGGIGVVLVVDESGQLLGTVTDGDVRRGLLRGLGVDGPVREIMNASPVTAPLGTPRSDLLALMRSSRKRQVPLLSDGRLADIAWKDQLLDEQPAGTPSGPVVVMCGGLGTRLRPLTEDTPKPLLRVGGKPVLEHLIAGLAGHGFKSIYLAVNYQAEKIEEYFADGHPWGVSIEYVRESKELGTAGALSLLRDRLAEPALVLNGDLVTGMQYGKFLEFHIERGSDLTIGVKPHDVQVPYGVVKLQGDRVRQIEEKPVYSYFTNTGIYAVNPDVLRLIPHDQRFDMTDVIGELLASDRQVGALPVHEYWLDIGRRADYEKAHQDISNGRL